MKTSCGILLIENNKLLMCHATLSNPSRWDIPKGELNPGENPLSCAIRELKEETGLIGEIDNTIDLGIFNYLPSKALHLYISKQKLPDISTLKCTSYFELYNKQYLEVDEFKLIPFNQIKNYASKALFAVLNQALHLWRDYNENHQFI